ncbi:MAG TPA: VWA domain-containing protein [Thermoanaerobaculia bacterium]|nr:VWA domain-containing protein [Thermoanaerobaculia bacterium]
MRRVPLVLALAAALMPLVAPAPLRAGDRAELREAEKNLPEAYKRWLEEVDALITDEERAAFLALEKDYQRDAFIERFWQVRDPYPDTARNELRDSWQVRVAEVRQSYGDLQGDRARIYLLNGPPSFQHEDQCGTLLWPTDVWIYPPSPRVRDTLVLVFVRRFGGGQWRIWYPQDGLRELFQWITPNATVGQMIEELRTSCVRSDTFAAAIISVLNRGQFDYSSLVDRALEPIEGPSREWVSTFNSYSTELPDGATRLEGEVVIDYPSRRQSRTVVQATVSVPAAAAGTAEFGGHSSYNFLLNGEVLRDGRLFDSFRYRFDLPAAEVATESIPLVFERFLRPGAYRMVVKVEDLNGHAFFRSEQALEVPTVEGPPPPPLDDESAQLLAEANAALSTLDNTIEIVEPRGTMQSGLIRFDTLTTGPDISEVQFTLDDKPILRKNRPPYSVELDLGEIPATRTLLATAFDAESREVASDQVLLNASPHRFSIRLVEPRRGKRYARSLRAEAQVEVPEGETLERVEFWLNETLVATLYQEPFTQPIVLPTGEFIAYVRAVAYQTDGHSTEDLVFVNAPENLEEVDVQFVELYTTVVDRQGHPVADLPRAAFSVREDDVPQELARFEKLENLPVHIAVLLDVSASMEPRLDAARDAALKLFHEAITPRDRAALIPFNDRPRLAVKMTSRIDELAGGLAGLKAERGTALYDSVVFSLFYFNGLKGQRALLLLSDGKDENSRFDFEQTLDFARRAGVAIYTIGLDLKRTEFETRKVLKSLADETGGRSFFVGDTSELGPVYDAIEQELRSRYLLAYQSTNTDRSLKFRTVEVEVGGSGLEAKTMRGYYP